MIESETDMHVRHLSVADPEALEAALEAAPVGTVARVTTPDGVRLYPRRVPGGWYLPGDMAVASADVVAGQPRAVALLRDDLDAWAEEAQGEYLPPVLEIEQATLVWLRAREAGNREAAENLTAGLDDLDSVGFAEAGALRDEILAWLEAGE